MDDVNEPVLLDHRVRSQESPVRPPQILDVDMGEALCALLGMV